MALLFAGCGILMIGFYFAYQLRDWIIPPKLSLETPVDGATIQGPSVIVEGNATPGVRLTINGILTYNEDTGHFHASLLFPAGLHTVEVIAENRFGRTRSILHRVVVTESASHEIIATSTEANIYY